MPRTAAIYARQSNTHEGSESLAVQVEHCREVAERFGLEVVTELVEPPSTSAYKNRGRSRPRFLELLGLIRSGAVQSVVIYKTDRLSRGGGVGYAPLLEAVEEAGHNANKFILSREGWLSEFELGIRATMDREEASKIAQRMTDVRAHEARAGKPRPGLARGYGYERDCVSIIETEAARIREAASRVLAGESVYSVVMDWNRQGVPTVGGARWSTTTLKRLLSSGRIAGLREHHGVVVADGVWEGIITPDEHQRLKALLAPRTTRGVRPRTFPLVGFLFCEKCGQKLRSLCKSEGRRAYDCRKGDNLTGCGGTQIKADWAEQLVRDYVVTALTDPLTRQRLLAALPQPDDRRQVDLLTELRDVDLRRQRLTDLAVDGTLPPAEVRRKNLELDEEADRINRQLADAPLAHVSAAMPTNLEDLQAAWDQRGIDYQRTLIAMTIDRITIGAPTKTNRRLIDPERLTWALRV